MDELRPKTLLPSIEILTTSTQGTPKQPPQVYTIVFGKFCFLNEVKKSPVSSLDVSKAKAPHWYSTYITFCTCTIKESFTLGDDQVIQQFHRFLDILWNIVSYLVCYVFPAQIVHSLLVLPYEQKYVYGRQTKKFKKIASKAEFKWYTDRCNVNKGKSTWMNLLIGHTKPIKELFPVDLHYLLDSESMFAIFLDVQAPTSTTCGYLFGIDDKTIDYKELTNIIYGYKHFANITITVNIQKLRIRKDQ